MASVLSMHIICLYHNSRSILLMCILWLKLLNLICQCPANTVLHYSHQQQSPYLLSWTHITCMLLLCTALPLLCLLLLCTALHCSALLSHCEPMCLLSWAELPTSFQCVLCIVGWGARSAMLIPLFFLLLSSPLSALRCLHTISLTPFFLPSQRNVSADTFCNLTQVRDSTFDDKPYLNSIK